jgi:glycosyltransferase involved in cell wall biosynthesis
VDIQRDKAFVLSEPLVSVITPAYNRLHYIERTINSVLNQTYCNVEYIIVDDGSTDGTYELLCQFEKQGRIRLLCHDKRKNRGQSISINFGLKKAKGDYIAILDSDDLFHPDKLRLQVEFLQNNSKIGMVYGQGIAIDEFENELYMLFPPTHQETNDPNLLLMDCYIPSPGVCLARKSVYEKVGFFEEKFRAGQDHDMAIRIMEQVRIAYLPEVSFYYRKHPDSISIHGLEKRWKTGFKILERAKNRYPYKIDTIRKRSAVLNFRLGQVYFSDKKFLKSCPYFLKSGLFDPVRAIRIITGIEKIDIM